MVRKIFLSLGLTSLVVSGLMACEPQGCTPGFWKSGNHMAGSGSFISTNPKTYPTDSYLINFKITDQDTADKVLAMVKYINEKAYIKLDNMTPLGGIELGEALWMKGNKDDTDGDKFLQLVRTSTAALLNIRSGLDYVVSGYGLMDEGELLTAVQDAFKNSEHAEELQKALDYANNEGCPL